MSSVSKRRRWRAMVALLAVGVLTPLLAGCDANDISSICTSGADGTPYRDVLILAKFLCIGYHIDNTVQPRLDMSLSQPPVRLSCPSATGTAVLPSGSTVPSGTTICFNAAGSRTGDMFNDPIRRYEWDFEGNGHFFDGDATPTYMYSVTATASKTITVRLTDQLGAVATASVTLTIAGPGPGPGPGTGSGSGPGPGGTPPPADPPPTAAFTASPASALPYDVVTFDGTASNDPDGQIADYKWNFGDGSVIDSGGQVTTEHSFACTGTVTVSLTITDESGQTAQAQESYVVARSPYDPQCQPGGARVTRLPPRDLFAARFTQARLVRAGTFHQAGDTARIRGLVLRGRLDGRIAGAPGLKPFTHARWIAQLTLVSSSHTGLITLQGVVLATFPGTIGTACLQLNATRRGSALPVGAFTILGGTGKAAHLSGGGTVLYGLDADGFGRLAGRLHVDRRKAHALPAACRRLMPSHT